ncbi:sensor histidine kinase [Cryptosporangium aurantiacum]|uniref:histidine kinase n=1 Tax=Cryptosporangium aurantiacum TaxID=134849 RepID=A0A1M7IAX9_9ACTN|nr:histidine kinase [Cryptosporangium aurantiacum]SHM37738.1 Signal transduction histidine kinase [Cryptosporangium aurantiacum]
MTGVWSYVRGLWDAAVRAPIKPVQARPWIPRRGWPRWALGAVWIVAAVGWTGGTIAELVLALRVPAVVAPFVGMLLALPSVVAPLRPLLAWRLMVVGVLITPLAVALGPRDDAVWPWPVTACVAMLLTLVMVGASSPRPVSVGAGLLTTAAVFAFGAVAGMPFWMGYILAGGIFAGLLFGDATGGRRSVQARLDEQRALRRQDLARQAVLEERGRIARELHDVVAHHMTMIAIQAEAAPLKVPDVPPAAAEIFAAINRAAREALSETRTVVGLLRSEDDAAERAPAPGLELLDDLVERARATGLTVKSVVVGVPRPLSAAVDVSAYRIVQEALSNASRYAPGSSVRVEVRYGPQALHLSVTNTAVDAGQQPNSAATQSDRASLGGGHGLVGIRERATMLGGEMSAGPLPGGGFAVTAVLPTGASPGPGAPPGAAASPGAAPEAGASPKAGAPPGAAASASASAEGGASSEGASAGPGVVSSGATPPAAG